MYFSHISIGGGITGLETIISTFAKIKKELQKSQNAKKRIKPKKITFAIIDKNPENIPGGVAYGFSLSRYGYFNNPIRLSPTQFTNWLLYEKNKNETAAKQEFEKRILEAKRTAIEENKKIAKKSGNKLTQKA